VTTPRCKQIDMIGRKADRLLIHHWREMSEDQINTLAHQSLHGFFARAGVGVLHKNGYHAVGGMRVIEGGQGQ
jgi:hypothetical protein